MYGDGAAVKAVAEAIGIGIWGGLAGGMEGLVVSLLDSQMQAILPALGLGMCADALHRQLPENGAALRGTALCYSPDSRRCVRLISAKCD